MQYFIHHYARFVIVQNTHAKCTNLHAKFQSNDCEIFHCLSKHCNFALYYQIGCKIWQSAIFHEIINFNRICISLKLAKFHNSKTEILHVQTFCGLMFLWNFAHWSIIVYFAIFHCKKKTLVKNCTIIQLNMQYFMVIMKSCTKYEWNIVHINWLNADAAIKLIILSNVQYFKIIMFQFQFVWNAVDLAVS